MGRKPDIVREPIGNHFTIDYDHHKAMFNVVCTRSEWICCGYRVEIIELTEGHGQDDLVSVVVSFRPKPNGEFTPIAFSIPGKDMTMILYVRILKKEGMIECYATQTFYDSDVVDLDDVSLRDVKDVLCSYVFKILGWIKRLM